MRTPHGRVASLPQSVAGIFVNRLCASALGRRRRLPRVIAGDALFVAGGIESMSRARRDGETPARRSRAVTTRRTTPPNPRMEMPRSRRWATGEKSPSGGASREDQDEFALASQQRWAAAHDAGRFDDEIVAVGDVGRDEHPRSDTSLEKLAALKPAFRDGGSVTAGNASGINDGAAALVIASEEKARELGLEPLGAFVGSAAAGVDPRVMGIGPVPAVRKLLERTGVDVSQLDLVELNEAFASQSLAVILDLGLDREKVNVNGGAIAIGHPLGMSGARLVVSSCTSFGAARAIRIGDAVRRRRPGAGRAVRATRPSPQAGGCRSRLRTSSARRGRRCS